MQTNTTQLTQRIAAPRAQVYRALLDAQAVAQWMVPDGMTSEVHQFEARVGGRFRVSLTYSTQPGEGKATAHTDTYHGHFVTLVPDREVIEVLEFETGNPALPGQMKVTMTLSDDGDGTLLHALHEDLPPGVPPADNELGWRISLGKLAALVERESASAG